MNAIEEATRLKELRLVMNGDIPVLTLKVISELNNEQLKQLWDDVTNYVHTHTLDTTTDDHLKEYFFDICDELDGRNIAEMNHLDAIKYFEARILATKKPMK